MEAPRGTSYTNKPTSVAGPWYRESEACDGKSRWLKPMATRCGEKRNRIDKKESKKDQDLNATKYFVCVKPVIRKSTHPPCVRTNGFRSCNSQALSSLSLPVYCTYLGFCAGHASSTSRLVSPSKRPTWGETGKTRPSAGTSTPRPRTKSSVSSPSCR